MTEIDIINTLYGKLGLFGILCLVIWKVYHDMKNDKANMLELIRTVEKRHETYVQDDHERVMSTLEGTNTSREKLAQTLDRLSRAMEGLPCNLAQPVEKRWVTPTPGDSTPPEGNKS